MRVSNVRNSLLFLPLLIFPFPSLSLLHIDKWNGVQVSDVIGRLGLALPLGFCLDLGFEPGLLGERKGRRSRGRGLGCQATYVRLDKAGWGMGYERSYNLSFVTAQSLVHSQVLLYSCFPCPCSNLPDTAPLSVNVL